MKPSNFHRTIMRALALASFTSPLALSAGCDVGPDDDAAAIDAAPAEPSGDELPPLRDGEERFGEGVNRFSEVEVQGTRLLFLQVLTPEMDAPRLEIIEVGVPGGASLSIEPDFAEASMLDVFLAVTPADWPIPDELRGETDHELGARGWFADRLARNEYVFPRSICTNATFQDDLRDLQPTIDTGERWMLDAQPGDDDWYGPDDDIFGGGIDCSGTCPSIWYAYNWNSWDWPDEPDNADASKEAVAICAIGYHPPYTAGGDTYTGIGPVVEFWHRYENDSGVTIPYSIDLAAPAHMRRYHMGNSTTDNNFDRRVRIYNAVAGEVFDIGYIWGDYGW